MTHMNVHWISTISFDIDTVQLDSVDGDFDNLMKQLLNHSDNSVDLSLITCK